MNIKLFSIKQLHVAKASRNPGSASEIMVVWVETERSI